jgi:hypothetical protein
MSQYNREIYKSSCETICFCNGVDVTQYDERGLSDDKVQILHQDASK